MQKTFNIKTINLSRYYLLIIVSVFIAIISSLFISFLFKNTVQMNYSIFLILSLIISFLLLEFGKKYCYNDVSITINNKGLLLKTKEEIWIEISEIKSYSFRNLLSNFPLFKIKLKNGKIIKFRSKSKTGEIDSFFCYFDKVIVGGKL